MTENIPTTISSLDGALGITNPAIATSYNSNVIVALDEENEYTSTQLHADIKAINQIATEAGLMPAHETTTHAPTEENIVTSLISTDKYKTTTDHYIAIQNAGYTNTSERRLFVFDNKFNFIEERVSNGELSAVESLYGTCTTKLRVGKTSEQINETINKYLNEREEKKTKYKFVDKVGRFDILLSLEDFSLNVDFNDEVIPLTNDVIAKMKWALTQVESLKLEFIKQEQIYKTGDRVLLYGPTGTGKTYDFLSAVGAMHDAGTIDDYVMVTITEGFTDVDFLAHIIPTDKGIRYQENSIVQHLRDASKGKRVAILFDELNRGSREFMNLVLKLLDAVNGDTYLLNNFIQDEIIEVPIANVFFMATMNLGGKYTGTNALDEALLDRFNIVQHKGYNPDVEDKMLDAFGEHKAAIKTIIDSIRLLATGGEIRAPISTRGIKIWAELFINSPKTKEDVFNTFQYSLLNRLTSVDDFGNPNNDELATILKYFKDKGFVKL